MFVRPIDKHMEISNHKCVFCSKKFTGYGNRPWPVKKKGFCCDECNFNLVLPERMIIQKRISEQLQSIFNKPK
jgi:DNA-directed RNA polymerase subunit RPC12/RpoP